VDLIVNDAHDTAPIAHWACAVASALGVCLTVGIYTAGKVR